MPFDTNKPGMPQTIEVERQAIGSNPEFGCNLTRRHTIRPRPNEQAICVQPTLLSQRRKRGHDLIFFHSSTIIELMCICQYPAADMQEDDAMAIAVSFIVAIVAMPASVIGEAAIQCGRRCAIV
jgi:hypothetical protein